MNIKEKYRAFKEWQQRPYQVKPLSQEEHTCATCHTTYQGNYCPRCGQSSVVGRYSFKTAFLLFLDVWGLGNRGMFRSIRDLLLRPGYMIRDYLSGMQMAYFPPFKMFFLLIAFSILVKSGFNIHGENHINETVNTLEQGYNKAVDARENTIEIETKASRNGTMTEEQKATRDFAVHFFESMRKTYQFVSEHETIVTLMWLLALSLPLYLFFKSSPRIPDLRFPEFFVAIIYMQNMMTIVSAAAGFFCFYPEVIETCSAVLSIVALKQLSGYTYKRVIFKTFAAFIILTLASILLVALGIAIVGFVFRDLL